MEINDRIEKLQIGGRVNSRRDLNEAEAIYKLTLSTIDSNDPVAVNRQLQAAAYLTSVFNASSANPSNNKRERHKSAEAYRIATKMLNGDFNVAEVSNPYAGKLSRPGGYSDADNYAVDYMDYNLNKLRSSTVPVLNNESLTAIPTGDRETYKFVWNRELNEDLSTRGTSFADRIKSFASLLYFNIKEAESKKQEGALIKGKWNSEHLTTLSKIVNGEYSDIDAYNALGRIAEYYGETGDHWNEWFQKYLPKDLKYAELRATMELDGYTFIDNPFKNELILNAAGGNYKVATKGGKTYLIKDDYSGVVTDAEAFDIDQDYNSSTYGYGYRIGADGSVYEGNMLELDLTKNPYYKEIIEYIDKNIKTNNDKKYFWRSDLDFNHLTDFGEGDNNVIDHFALQLNGKKIVDVSAYFGGEEVIATFTDNDPSKHVDIFGNLRFDKNTTLYCKTDKGFETFTGDMLQSKGFTQNFKDTLTYSNLGNFKGNSSEFDLMPILTDTERAQDINNHRDGHNWWFDWGRAVINPWCGNEKIDANAGVDLGYNTLDKSARLFLTLLAGGDNDVVNAKGNPKDDAKDVRYIHNYIDSHRKVVAKVIYDYLKKGTAQRDFGAHYLAIIQAWRDFILNYKGELLLISASTQSAKSGGVLKAASGTGFNSMGVLSYLDLRSAAEKSAANRFANRDALVKRAEENGNSLNKLSAIEEGWTSSDTLRATALATDIVGLIAAIAGPATEGVGTAVAVGSGFASMVLDAIADFSDDKVSAGQAWKNIGINTGLAFASAVGGKAPKMIKSVIKLLPKAMMAIGTAGVVLDPEVLETVGKVASGKDLNINDWKNISIVLRTATGLATVKTINYKTKKGQAEYNKRNAENLKAITSELDPNIKYVASEDGKSVIPLEKSIYELVNKALKTGKEEDTTAALLLLTKAKSETNGGAGLSEIEAKAVIQRLASKKKGWDRAKFWKENPEELSLRDATVDLISELTDVDLRAAARLRTLEQFNIKNKSRALKYNPIANSALNEAAAQGSEYKNIRELIAGDLKKLKPINPYSLEPGTFEYTEAEMSQHKADIGAALRTEAERLKTSENQSGAKADVALQQKKATNKKIKEGIDAERMRQFAARGKDTKLKTTKKATVVINGAEKEIPEGTSTKSFKSIRDAEQAKKIVMSDPNMKELTRSEINKIYPANISSQIRGAAYNEVTGELAVWEKGGQINFKYQHLRK